MRIHAIDHELVLAPCPFSLSLSLSNLLFPRTVGLPRRRSSRKPRLVVRAHHWTTLVAGAVVPRSVGGRLLSFDILSLRFASGVRLLSFMVPRDAVLSFYLPHRSWPSSVLVPSGAMADTNRAFERGLPSAWVFVSRGNVIGI